MIRLTKGCSLGVWTRQPLDQYQAWLGWPLGNIAFFARWGHRVGLDRLRPTLAAGSVYPLPIVNYPPGGTQAQLDMLVAELEAYGHPVVIRYDSEMDRRPGSPSAFIADWNRVRTYIRTRYAKADFAWVPTGYGLTRGGGMRAAAYWPGIAAVDWAGCDVYDLAPGGRSFATAFGPAYEWLVQQGCTRLVVAETGVTNAKDDAYRAQWVRDMLATAKADFPALRAIAYFDEDKTAAEGPGRDWRLRPSTAAGEAWQAAHSSTYFHSRPWKS